VSDIVEQLRASVTQCRAVDRSSLLAAAADEIERLRLAIRRLADQDATLSVRGGSVTVTLDATLTDEEQWAIREAVGAYYDIDDDEECAKIAATLHGLLKRQNEAASEAVRLMAGNASRYGFLLGGLEMIAAGHTTADRVLAAAKAKYGDGN
jgi:hypothetical protein